MIKSYTIIILISILSLNSCKKKSSDLIGVWEFKKMVTEQLPTASIDFDKKAFKSYIIFSGDGKFIFVDYGELDVYKISEILDDTYYKPRSKNGRTYYGDWNSIENDSIVNLVITNYQTKSNLKLSPIYNDNKKLEFTLNTKTWETNNNHKVKYEFRKIIDNDISDYENSFMTTKTNSWRIRSQKKESKKEIISRIYNALEFNLIYLKFHKEKELNALTYFSNPFPIKFGRNGVSLDKNIDWENLFYDFENADLSYDILYESIILSPKIPEKLRNKPLEINIFILEGALKKLKELAIKNK